MVKSFFSHLAVLSSPHTHGLRIEYEPVADSTECNPEPKSLEALRAPRCSAPNRDKFHKSLEFYPVAPGDTCHAESSDWFERCGVGVCPPAFRVELDLFDACRVLGFDDK